ncbi:hypothetical protein NDU88_001496 [Pleurodeles waltl]|uniref:Uncharacterized protein n=1 Tax=Pleurodeles waltl TaxID=8319 RepID=A0AAV7UT00_PLEWA|nr:hypothetical protein NDU88_001496 [Pleurodeles waltl]
MDSEQGGGHHESEETENDVDGKQKEDTVPGEAVAGGKQRETAGGGQEPTYLGNLRLEEEEAQSAGVRECNHEKSQEDLTAVARTPS